MNTGGASANSLPYVNGTSAVLNTFINTQNSVSHYVIPYQKSLSGEAALIGNSAAPGALAEVPEDQEIMVEEWTLGG